MDHGPPHWLNQPHARPPADMGPWRGMYPPPPPHHYRDSGYGYYPPYPMQSGHQAWPSQWTDYYSQHTANISRHIDHRRPASRAEMYDRSEAYRPLSRQGFDERYGFYKTVHRENYGNRDYNYEPPVGVSREKDRRRIYDQQIEHWVQTSSNTCAIDPNFESIQPQTYAYRSHGYEDNTAPHPAEKRCESAMDRIEYFSATEQSILSQYRDSGMSSSSYELSQYMQDPANLIDSWNPLQDDTLEQTPQPTAPMKFSLPHVTVCFGARGQLIRVRPSFPDEGQLALVEIHSIEVLLHDTSEQEEMRRFPGPVQREDLHKVDVMNYCQQNVSQCLRSQGARSRNNALLWQVLLQMCRQNGCIAGTDLADLLLQDCKRERYRKEQEYSELISLDEPPLIPDGAQMDLLTGEVPSTEEMSTRAVEKFTKLLYFGRKKEALDWAMKSQLWGHALFLSSKMDSRTYSWVMARFTSTLAVNDPLQTLFQLMTGRIPKAATCCGDNKWGDWRPHLAVMLSNHVSDPELNYRAMITMGDNLVLKGLTEAGHCCYLTAGISLGNISEKSDRLVLLGSNQNQRFKKFASTANIQRTEILEYCQSLGKICHCIPSFQIYKFVYATRLMDYGLTSVALHYCECIASAILHSSSGSPVLISELIKLADRLKYSDPQILERPEPEQNQEPTWLVQLRALFLQLQGSNTSGRITPATSEEQGNSTEPNKVHPVNEVHQVIQEHDTGAEIQNTEAELVRDSSWAPQYTNLPPVEPQGENNYEWVVQQPGPIPELSFGYNIYNEPQEKASLEEISDSPSPSSSFSNNALMMKQALMSRRVSTVSETSTVSMDDDDSETRSSDDAQAHKVEENKGSSFGWFNWFRSKPRKETVVPPREASKSSSQTKPPVGLDTFQPPPTPSSYYQPPEATSNSFYTGIKETEDPQKISSSSVSSEIQGQQRSMETYPNIAESQINQPTGPIPLYNPSQNRREFLYRVKGRTLPLTELRKCRK
ncbi:protein transport protein Sec16B isoform X2 [Hyla sarda]|uniref:protein transport protein Sec16B isoform X2 n=1 Tax=Hyla sarda TaxID=327740 RepID=UPI0024C34D7E|nr:protein transport protein Sec16B isoform X2 [Hyla sarda]